MGTNGLWVWLLAVAGLVVAALYAQGRLPPADQVTEVDTEGTRTSQVKPAPFQEVRPWHIEPPLGLEEAEEEGHTTVRHSRLAPSPLQLGQYPLTHLVYLNLDRATERDTRMKAQLAQWGLRERGIEARRLRAIEKTENGALGCYLSHLAALEPELPGHQLILEDDFELSCEPRVLWRRLREASERVEGRWDVIVLGQYVTAWQPLDSEAALKPEGLFRLLRSTTTSGYLVHHDYRERLRRQWLSVLSARPETPKRTLENEPWPADYHLDQVQCRFQPQDLWLGFRDALGTQREGHSFIGDRNAHNAWTADPDLRHWRDAHGQAFPLQTLPPLRLKRVGLCHVATGKYNQYVRQIHRELSRGFAKPHLLRFFLFTDQPELYATEAAEDGARDNGPPRARDNGPYQARTAQGHPLTVVKIERQGFPGDTLYRYHYMLKAEQELQQQTDYVFYTDVDYGVLVSTPDVLPTRPGLVATEHLHNLQETRRPDGRIGSPEERGESTACIPGDPKRPMWAYYAGGVQGGSTEEWLEACRTMKERIDEDDRKGVVAVWHDESHWNKYLWENPPTKVLNQSYIYPDYCLTEERQDEAVCQQLRKHQVVPIMLPLSKDHQAMRS